VEVLCWVENEIVRWVGLRRLVGIERWPNFLVGDMLKWENLWGQQYTWNGEKRCETNLELELANEELEGPKYLTPK
jgi:hypothetical protein